MKNKLEWILENNPKGENLCEMCLYSAGEWNVPRCNAEHEMLEDGYFINGMERIYCEDFCQTASQKTYKIAINVKVKELEYGDCFLNEFEYANFCKADLVESILPQIKKNLIGNIMNNFDDFCDICLEIDVLE